MRSLRVWLGITVILLTAACGGDVTERADLSGDDTAAACLAHLDVTAREPMLVEHPDGALFVAGYGRVPPTVEQQPRLWRSDDDGASWQRVDVGPLDAGAVGNSDVDLTIGPDGALWFAAMGFDRSTGAGTHVAVGHSRDVGRTWRWSWLTRDAFADRPWLRVASDGTVHAVWNDDTGLRYAVGTAGPDGETTWTERPRIHPTGGSSHLALGPHDELAVRISPIAASANRFDPAADELAVSVDGGATWTTRRPPGNREWTPDFSGVPRWVEPLAWDRDATLWSLWSEGSELNLGRSDDLGASWREWVIESGTDVAYFPYLVARGPGELAATWFSGTGEALTVHAARIDASDADATPVVTVAATRTPDSWTPGAERQRDPAGEYVPVAFLADGSVAVVLPIQDEDAGRGGFCYWPLDSGGVVAPN